MKFNIFFLSIIALSILFGSCTNEIDDSFSFSGEQEFYPLALDQERIYQMDSIIYDNNGRDVFESTSYIRERVLDVFESGNEQIYQLEISWSLESTGPWTFQSNWSVSLSEDKVIRNEENLRFIKMIFPPTEGANWDGNQLFDEFTEVTVSGESIFMYKNWDYQVTDRVEAEMIGITPFDDVITIQQADNENAIERRYSIEKYAKNIGLVYREQVILDSQCFSACMDNTWEEKAEKGFILRQMLIKY